MKDKMIAVLVLLMATVLMPTFAAAAPKTKPKAATPMATAAEGWSPTAPSSCTVEGPPPCDKCTVSCAAGKTPICIPGENSLSGTTSTCSQPPSCSCK